MYVYLQATMPGLGSLPELGELQGSPISTCLRTFPPGQRQRHGHVLLLMYNYPAFAGPFPVTGSVRNRVMYISNIHPGQGLWSLEPESALWSMYVWHQARIE